MIDIKAYVMPGLSRRPTMDAMKQKKAEQITRRVCEHMGFEVEQVKGKSQKGEIALCRNICFYLIKKYTKLNLADIGEMFGGRHHTTVLSGRGAIKGYLEVDLDFRDRFYRIQSACDL